MTFCSQHAVIDFDVPPTASHKNNSAKLVRANGAGYPPALFQVAIYGLLQLAAILAYGFQRTAAYLPLPLWRRKSIRPSTLDLLNLLRDPIFARLLQDEPTPGIDDFAALAPVDANAAKLPLASETLCTMAAQLCRPAVRPILRWPISSQGLRPWL
jgi:hypothetical protein